MIRYLAPLFFAAAFIQIPAILEQAASGPPTQGKQAKQDKQDRPIRSRVEKTAAGELILIEEVWIEAPIADVWAAYTTEKGFTAWACPKAKIDLRVGGKIRTQYDPKAKIGDPGTNTLHIVNYVPKKLLTLRADISENWPEIMKRDADNMSNVVLFEALSPRRTKIVSYGIGYRAAKEYDTLMKFFITANKKLYGALKKSLERS